MTGLGFYFLGTDEVTSGQAVERIALRYPQVKIAGRHHGFFTAAEEPGIIAGIQQAKPDILILAMGAPTRTNGCISIRRRLAGLS